MLSGMVFDIQRLCVHDGPGIRTAVFLKGCSLHCFWCHNPESINKNRQLMFFPKKCIQCGQCVLACKRQAHNLNQEEHSFNRSLCVECGECAAKCEAKALVMSGVTMTAAEVMDEILKDVAFYKTSKGGVTFSGGEPLMQIDFLEDLLIKCKEHNIHTAIETAGNVSWENFKRIMPYTDLFLYDLKAAEPTLHKNVTGVDNHRCLSNLEQLTAGGAQVTVRIPVIPGVNDSEERIIEMKLFLDSLKKDVEVELLPFHKMGQSKYDSLELEYKAGAIEPPSQELMQRLRNIISG